MFRLFLLSTCFVLISPKKFTVYRLKPADEQGLSYLQSLTTDNKLDFWKEPHALGQEVHVMVPEDQSQPFLEGLLRRNISESVMIDDVDKKIKEQDERKKKVRKQRRLHDYIDGRVSFNTAEYHSFADVINYMNALAVAYPNLVSVMPIGLTHEGRQIPLIKITNKLAGSNKARIWVDGGIPVLIGIHAREWVSPSTVLYFIHQLINGYGQDPMIKRFVDEMEWYLVPLLNPDGYEHSRSATDAETRLWRKNKSPAKCTTTQTGLFSPPQTTCCQGVDLNRNFDWFFGQVGSSTDPCSEIYNGAYAFSEPETRAVRDFLSQHPMTTFITLHSYSQILMYPFGHQVRTYPNDLDDMRNTALTAAQALQRLYGTVYKVGTGADTLYPASGGSEDWAKGKMGVKYSYLFELRPEEQVWDGFLLPESQIIPTARETWEAVKVIALKSITPIGGLRGSKVARAVSSSSSAPLPTARPLLRECKDHDSLCSSWARSGACNTWPEMVERCPVSCGVCTPVE